MWYHIKEASATMQETQVWSLGQEDSIYNESYVIKYYSAKKKKETLPFATTLMDFKGIMLNEINQSTDDFTYMWTLKNITNEQTKENKPHREQIGSC